MVNGITTSRKTKVKNAQDGEKLGVSAFGFLAGHEEYFEKFSEISGVGVGDIAELSGSPHFLASILEFLLTDDSMLLAFCQSGDWSPEDTIRAQHYLSEA